MMAEHFNRWVVKPRPGRNVAGRCSFRCMVAGLVLGGLGALRRRLIDLGGLRRGCAIDHIILAPIAFDLFAERIRNFRGKRPGVFLACTVECIERR